MFTMMKNCYASLFLIATFDQVPKNRPATLIAFWKCFLPHIFFCYGLQIYLPSEVFLSSNQDIIFLLCKKNYSKPAIIFVHETNCI